MSIEWPELPAPKPLSDQELLSEVKSRIKNKAEATNSVLERMKLLDRQAREIDDEIEALKVKKQILKDQKTPLEKSRWELSRAIKEDEKERDSLVRKLALAEAERLANEKAAAQRGLLSDLISTATWSDRALPHQLEGMYYMSAAKRVLCGDAMGTGKTLQSIMTVEALQALKEGGKRTLIIAPGELCVNFQEECDLWAPELLVISLANLGTDQTLEDLAFWDTQLETGKEDHLVILINYEILARSQKVLQDIIDWQPDTVICDEAHRIKETGSKSFMAIKKIVHAWNTCPECGALCFSQHQDGINYYWNEAFRFGECGKHGIVQCVRSVQNFIAMSGTFILNSPTEIYASLHLARDDMFKSFNEFVYDYAYKNYNGRYQWQTGGESRLVNRIKGMYIRRTVHDAGIKLPPQKINIHEMDFDPNAYPKQAQLLSDLVKNALMEIDEGRVKNVSSMLALITRQRQATVWPGGIYVNDYGMDDDGTVYVKGRIHVGANYLESQKLDWACEMMDKFEAEGVRYAVMSLFREPLDELHRRRGNKTVLFHGGTDAVTRAKIKRNFNRQHILSGEETQQWDGVLAHYTLGGEGLNLTDITQLIILDEQWNVGKNEQAYARIQRMGQTEETAVHIPRMKGPGCMDMWMAALNEEKRKIVDGFNTEFTFAELADIFRNM